MDFAVCHWLWSQYWPRCHTSQAEVGMAAAFLSCPLVPLGNKVLPWEALVSVFSLATFP